MSSRDPHAFCAVITVERGSTRIAVSGVIDEKASLDAIAAAEGTQIEIDMGAVRRINSYGVRAWMNAMRALQRPGVRVGFARCAPVVVDQIDMVHGFLGSAEVHSFLAPRLCEDCDQRAEQLIELSALRAAGGKLPDIDCPRCRKPMELDDVAHKYELLLTLLPAP